jgi:hypothetical protein
MTVQTLETYFSQRTIPQTLQLSEAEFIKDLPKMIASHISFLKGNSGNVFFMGYWDRLVKVYNILNK